MNSAELAEIPVCVFAKPPVAGRVKTRLAAVLGAREAAELAAAMLCDVWSVVESVSEAVPVLAAAEPGEFGIDVQPDRFWLQQPGDLGSRVHGILQRALEKAPAVIALGADSPLVTQAHLERAIDSLRSFDAVLGPCKDGGFYLLGLESCPAGLLDNIRWSCQHTCSDTESRLRSYGMDVARIATLSDVDTIEDVGQLGRCLRTLPPVVAPHTRKWLEASEWSVSSFRL